MNTIITRKHIKYLRLKIDRDGQVIISAPRHMSQRQIDHFLKEKQEWIESNQQKVLSKKENKSLLSDQILLYGNIYSYIQDRNLRHEVIVDMNKYTITSDLDLTEKTRQTQRLKEYAKEILTTQLQELSRKHNKSFNKLIIRDQKTKWGTCSSKKNIWLNRRLIRMPPTIAEYVICHELAHLQEMNHSLHFWKHLDTLYPQRKRAVKRLKDNGTSLQ